MMFVNKLELRYSLLIYSPYTQHPAPHTLSFNLFLLQRESGNTNRNRAQICALFLKLKSLQFRKF